ncbi:GNAT family N-acetyltransferase [Alkalihalobacillus sp. LMS39]|uniref:GNAT family N-acetyltransferase n=1 Tax=Alkalihalobacillus sp. LMS39 TaxID=2924032 RepID=UPI003261402A
MDYSFQVLQLPFVVVETQAANRGSCKLLEKLGMEMNKKVERFGAEQIIYRLDAKK